MVRRVAKLFEAGCYPERNLEIAADQITAIAARFTAPVSVTLEHIGGRWQLGELTEVWSHDEELLGNISLCDEADAFLRRMGIAGLSVCLDADCQRLLEVSVTDNPRVADARMFTDQNRSTFRGEIIMNKQAETVENQQVADWLHQGRITPAAVPYAKTLLGMNDAVQFHDGTNSAASVFSQFMAAMPPVINYGELGEAAAQPEVPLSAEQRRFLSRHWPDIPAEQIASQINRE